jgi:hypothetical protein
LNLQGEIQNGRRVFVGLEEETRDSKWKEGYCWIIVGS